MKVSVRVFSCLFMSVHVWAVATQTPRTSQRRDIETNSMCCHVSRVLLTVATGLFTLLSLLHGLNIQRLKIDLS